MLKKKLILIPLKVKLNILYNKMFFISDYGINSLKLDENVTIFIKDLYLFLITDKNKYNLWLSQINNAIKGSIIGHIKWLCVYGIGYKVILNKNILTLYIGYSHTIDYIVPRSLSICIIDNVKIKIKGTDIFEVGNLAKNLKLFKLPNVYTGKGFKYKNEKIIRKIGKKK